LFIDLKGEFDQLYGDYLDEAIFLSAAGALAILLMLVWSLRSAQRLAPVALPLLLAIIFVLAGLHLGGQRLHLLHLIGMLLIVAVGSNYTLFLDRASSLADPEVRLSTGVATLTTAIGFGVLGLSSVPVLNAIGLTVGPGALLSLLLAVMFAAPIQPHALTDAPPRDTAATC
jgi:predicted exporter